jgi:hypothetical protein
MDIFHFAICQMNAYNSKTLKIENGILFQDRCSTIVQINFSYTFLGQAGRQHRDYVSSQLALLTLTEEHRKPSENLWKRTVKISSPCYPIKHLLPLLQDDISFHFSDTSPR